MPIGIVIHGGAGDVEPAEHDIRVRAIRAAVEAAWGPLQQGCSAVDAVELAVKSMEGFPSFNAGYGSVTNRDGVVELDALIMDGTGPRIGAVAAVQTVLHPISLARYVMERSEHHLMVGPGAEQFAAEQQFPLVKQEDLHVKPIAPQPTNKGGDTVGAVVVDSAGNVAVAVSTGGLQGKLPGRVGDTPLPGAGGYADSDLGAASATGVGEGIIRAMLTFRAVEMLATGIDPQTAAQQAMAAFTERFKGEGGMIMIGRDGRIGIAHNTSYMPVGFVKDGNIIARISGQGAD
jgi:beta-aspartyl-peptidase (threonine type)